MGDNNKKTKGFTGILYAIEKVFYFIEDKITIVCFTGMVIAVIYGIVMRFILRLPNMYGEEISRYLTVMSIFLGLGIVERRNGHMKVDLVTNALPKSVSGVLGIISRIITILLYAYLTRLAIDYMIKIKSFGQLSTCMRIPMWIMYLFMVIGFFEGMFHAFVNLWSTYFAKEKMELNDEAEITTS